MTQHRRYPAVHPYTVGFSNRFQSIKDLLDLSSAQYDSLAFLWHVAMTCLNGVVIVLFWYIDAFETAWLGKRCQRPTWLEYSASVATFMGLSVSSLLLLVAFVGAGMVAPSLRKHILSPNCAVELVTSVPAIGIWIASSLDIGKRMVYVPHFFRVWPLMTHLEICFEMRAPKSLRAPLVEVIRLMAAMLTSAGLFHLAENLFGHRVNEVAATACRNQTALPTIQMVSFFESLYFTVVTFGTIGYGDIEATNTVSRFVVIFVIFFAIYRFPSFFNKMGELAGARDKTLEYEDHLKGHAHVVVSGDLDTELIAHCVDMFCRGGYLVRDVDGKKFRVVILSPNEFSQHTQLLVNAPTFDGRVLLLRGSSQSRADLARAKVDQALAHFYVCNSELSSDEADTRTVLHTGEHVLAAPGVPQYIVVRRSENATIIKARLGMPALSSTTSRLGPFLPPAAINTMGSMTDPWFHIANGNNGRFGHSSTSDNSNPFAATAATALSSHEQQRSLDFQKISGSQQQQQQQQQKNQQQQKHHAVILERDKIFFAMIGAACVIPGAVPLLLALAGCSTKELHGKTLHPWCDMYEWGLESEVMRVQVPASLVGRTFFEISDAFAEFDITVLGFEIEEEIVSVTEGVGGPGGEGEGVGGDGDDDDDVDVTRNRASSLVRSSRTTGSSPLRVSGALDHNSSKTARVHSACKTTQEYARKSLESFFDSDTTDSDEDFNAKGNPFAAVTTTTTKRKKNETTTGDGSSSNSVNDVINNSNSKKASLTSSSIFANRFSSAASSSFDPFNNSHSSNINDNSKRLNHNVAKIALEKSREEADEKKRKKKAPAPPPPKQFRRRLVLNPKGKFCVAGASTRLIVVSISGAVVMDAVAHLETRADDIMALADENNKDADKSNESNLNGSGGEKSEKLRANAKLAVRALMGALGRGATNHLHRSAAGDLVAAAAPGGAGGTKGGGGHGLGVAARGGAAGGGESKFGKLLQSMKRNAAAARGDGEAAVIIPPESTNTVAAAAAAGSGGDASAKGNDTNSSPFRRLVSAAASSSAVDGVSSRNNDATSLISAQQNNKSALKPIEGQWLPSALKQANERNAAAAAAAAASSPVKAAAAAVHSQQEEKDKPYVMPGFTPFDPSVGETWTSSSSFFHRKQQQQQQQQQAPSTHSTAATAGMNAAAASNASSGNHNSKPTNLPPLDANVVLNRHILLIDLHSACKRGHGPISEHRRIDAERSRARKLFSLCRTVMLSCPDTPVVLLARGKIDFSFSELWATTSFPNPYHIDGCALDSHALKLCRAQDARGVAVFSTHDGATDEDFDTMAMLVSRSVDVVRKKKAQQAADVATAEALQRKLELESRSMLHLARAPASPASAHPSLATAAAAGGAAATSPTVTYGGSSGGRNNLSLDDRASSKQQQLQQEQQRKQQQTHHGDDLTDVPAITTIIAFTQSDSITLLPPFAKPRSVLDEMAQVSSHYVPSFMAGRVLTPQMVESLLFFSFFSTSLLDVVHAMLSLDGSGNHRPAFGIMPIPPHCRTWRELRCTLRTVHGRQPIALYRLVRAIQSEEEYNSAQKKAALAAGSSSMLLEDEEDDEFDDSKNVSRAAMAAKRSFRYRAKLARQHGLQYHGDSERAARHELRFVYLNPQLSSTALVATDLVFYLN